MCCVSPSRPAVAYRRLCHSGREARGSPLGTGGLAWTRKRKGPHSLPVPRAPHRPRHRAAGPAEQLLAARTVRPSQPGPTSSYPSTTPSFQRATCATRRIGHPDSLRAGPARPVGSPCRRVGETDGGRWASVLEQFSCGPRTGACAPYAEPI